MNSAYKDNFCMVSSEKTESMKPKPKIVSNIPFEGNFISQYSNNFNTKIKNIENGGNS